MRSATAIVLLVCLAAVLIPTVADAQQGSGTASITPSSDVPVGTQGTWTITYAAAAAFSTGTLEVVIPGGWTLPQVDDSQAAGFVRVTTTGSGDVGVSVLGRTITVSVDTLSAGEAIDVVYGDDGGGGNPGARARAPTLPESVHFTVRSDPSGQAPQPITSSPSLSVVAGEAAGFDIVPYDTTITAGALVPYTIYVVDNSNNRTVVAQQRTVRLDPPSGSFYLPSDPNTRVDTVTLQAGEGSIRVDLVGEETVSPADWIVVRTDDDLTPALIGLAFVEVEHGPVDTDSCSVEAATDIVADGSQTGRVTVTVFDRFRNPVPETAVELFIDSPSGDASQIGSMPSTDSSGVAVGYVTNTTAETIAILAAADAQDIPDTVYVRFIADSADANATTITADPTATADGLSTSSIVVTVRDANDNPVQGATVTLSVDPVARAILVQPDSVTNAAGVTAGSLSSTVTGPRVVRAKINFTVTAAESATVLFVPGPVTSFEWTVNTDSTLAGVLAEVVLTAKDAQSNTATDFVDDVELSTTSAEVADSVVEWFTGPLAGGAMDNAPGGDRAIYHFVEQDKGSVGLLVRDLKAETIRLLAQEGTPLQAVSPASIVISHNVADRIAFVAGGGQEATVADTVPVPVKVRVSDEYGNPVDEETVTFSVVEGDGSADVTAGGSVDGTGETDQNGELQCDVWRLGTGAGENVLLASISSGSQETAQITATGTPDVGAHIQMDPESRSVTVNSPGTVVTATLKDQYDNLVPDEVVNIFVHRNDQGELLNDPARPTTRVSPWHRWARTDTNGQVSVKYAAPETAGLKDSVDAYTEFVSADSVDDAELTTTVDRATDLRITFDGSDTTRAGAIFSFRVEAVDGNGNVDTDTTVVVKLLAEDGSQIGFSESASGPWTEEKDVTLVDGVHSLYGRGDSAGTWKIKVEDLVGTPPMASDSTDVVILDADLVAYYEVTTVAGVKAGQPFNVTIEARDQFDNRVMGAEGTVQLRAVDASTQVEEEVQLLLPQATLQSGRVELYERYELAKDIKIRAWDGENREGYSQALTIEPAAAAVLRAAWTDSAGVVAGTELDLEAMVLDEYLNPVADEVVDFTVTQGTGQLVSTSGSSDAYGRVSVAFRTDYKSGNNSVKATILTASGVERVDYFVSTVAGSINSLEFAPLQTSMRAGETIGVDIVAVDQYGNAVEQDDTTVVDLSVASGEAVPGDTSKSLTGGRLSTTVRSTHSGEFQLRAEAEVEGDTVYGISPMVSVGPADAYQVVGIPGEPTPVAAGGWKDLKVGVSDQYGNAKSNVPVRFLLIPRGGLDGKAYMQEGIAWTDDAGQAVDSLRTADSAGLNLVEAVINEGDDPWERDTLTVTTIPGGIHHYNVTTDTNSQTVGQPIVVTVLAQDINNNLVAGDDTTEVRLSLSLGTGWGPVVATLNAGTWQATVVDTIAGEIRFRAETADEPTERDESGIVTLTPDVPSSVWPITVLAAPDTITATGLSEAEVSAGDFKDQFGNLVAAETMATVEITHGEIITPDQNHDPADGNQQPISADGGVTFRIRSDSTAGDAVITVRSGEAEGTGTVHFAQRPAFVCPEAPEPSSVIVGKIYGFRVLVQNMSSTGVDLSSSTVFQFTAGTKLFEADLTAERSIAAGDTATLVFDSTVIDTEMPPGAYPSWVVLKGVDHFGSPFSCTSYLQGGSLLVTAIQITGITPPPARSIGQSETVRVQVTNPSPLDATIAAVDLTFSPTGNFIPVTSPDIGSIIAGNGATGTIRVPVTIGNGTVPGTYEIDASVTAQVGSNTVIDPSVDPAESPTWTVLSAVSLSYVDDSLSPRVVSKGQTRIFSVGIRNSGGALANLHADESTLSFNDGTTTVSTPLSQGKAVAPNSPETLEFRPVAVPETLAEGDYDVTLFLSGDENEVPFNTILYTAPGDYLAVQDSADISVAANNALHPDRQYRGSQLTMKVDVVNRGSASVVLDPDGTTISFSSFFTTLDPSETTTIIPGPNTLTFRAKKVDEFVDTRAYHPTVHLQGWENGIDFFDDFTIEDDSIVVEEAPAVSIVSIETSQDTITVGREYEIEVWMVVRNNGGAAVEYETSSIAFESGNEDLTDEYLVTPPDSFNSGAELPGNSASDTLTFKVQTFPSETVGKLTITGALAVLDSNTGESIPAATDGGGRGSLLVQGKAILSIESITPKMNPVTSGMTIPFEIEMVVRNTGGSDVELLLDDPNTSLSFETSGWGVSVRDTLSNGESVLAGGEAGTVVFDVAHAGSESGETGIGAEIQGTELNSRYSVTGTTGGPVLGNIVVQDSARIVVSNVKPSRTTLTNGSNVPWEISLDVTNEGGATVDLDLPLGFTMTFQDAIVEPDWIPPPVFEGGGTQLPPGQTRQLVVDVSNAGQFDISTSQDKSININISGRELSTGIERFGSGATMATVQVPPTIVYTAGNLQPSVVSRGQSVEFKLPLSNSDPNAATVELNRGETTLEFAGGFFKAFLKPSSPDRIPGGPDPTTLVFESRDITSSIPLGAQHDVTANLVWSENGSSDSTTKIDIPVSDLLVQEQPDLNIVGIIPERSTVTVGQDPWTIRMVLKNKDGAADVGLDLSDGATRLTLTNLETREDVTTEYGIIPPPGLVNSADTVLTGGQVDTLVFTVDTTGTTTGTIVVSGTVVGTDLNSESRVDVNATGGSFILQSEAGLEIASIEPTQQTATVSQDSGYAIKMAVRNTGGSTVDVMLDTVYTKLFFEESSGWIFDIDSTLSGGGTEIAGGGVDTVTFNVIRSGDTAGETTIRGIVKATVVNTGDTATAGAGVTGLGSIDLQSKAEIVIDAVTTTREHVTAGSGSAVPWEIVVAVSNEGGSSARLELPSSLNVSVSGGEISYDPVVELDDGGLILEPNTPRTLTIHVNWTGTFTEWGERDINVDFDAVEINSKRGCSPPTGLGSITIDKAPELTVLDLEPNVVSSGATVGFTVRVANADPLAATAVLDRAQTRLHFDGNNYSAFLHLSSSLAIGPGREVPIRFDSKLIGPSIAADTFDVNVDLSFQHNGNTAIAPITLVDSVVVESAPVLSITEIKSNREEVTAGQSGSEATWTITMTVHNGGAAGLELDLDSTKTDIWFELPDGSRDSSYILERPDSLSTGGTTLSGNGSAELVYTVLKTGDSTGVVEINGRVAGFDPSTEDELDDDTGDGGSDVITVQTPAALEITAIEHPPHETVTEGQAEWFIRMTVQNKGESDVNLVPDSCRVSFGTDNRNWEVEVQQELEGGGVRLEGRSSRVLLFKVDSAGTAGVWRIDGHVEGKEVNSKNTKNDTTDTSGFGSIEVQVPPRIRLEVTELDAPRPPWVNAGQRFHVKANVANLDDGHTADAKNVKLQITGSGDSEIDAASYIFESVPSGSTAVHLFPVTAGSAGNVDTFTVKIADAEDENSSSSVAPLLSLDSTAIAYIQEPAKFRIVSVEPERSEVTRNQETPWGIDVVVRNDGSAPMELVPPDESNINFYLGNAEASGYTVEPPNSFVSRQPGDWIIDSLGVETLSYNVIATGRDTGSVTIEATLKAVDLNTGVVPDTAVVDSGSVHVQEVSGLYIASTVTDSTFNNPTPNSTIVNIGQKYKMLVTLKNTNTGEAVDNVRIELVSDGSSAVTKKGEANRHIASGDSSLYVFEVTADAVGNALETFTASIHDAVSANSGEPISPSTAVDDDHIVTTQTPANLTISKLWISAPSTVKNDRVSKKQSFELTARVENTGQGDVTGTAEVALTATGFTFQDQDPLKTFELADEKLLELTWQLTAPDSVLASPLTVQITDIPTDKNDEEPADTTDASKHLIVSVVEASLLAEALYVSSPPGAQDDTVSTDQIFTVVTTLTATEAVGQIEAAIELPSVFQTIGASTVDFGNGPFERQEASFQVRAPADSVSAGITVKFMGVDVNTDSVVTVISDTLRIDVVEKARLALSAEVSPGKNVAINSLFTLQAVVTNHGHAGIAADPEGTVTIVPPMPDGYMLKPGYSLTQTFSLDEPVTWEVRAPSMRSGPDEFVIRVDDKPLDENTGVAAVVDTFERTISIFTEGATIEISENQSAISNNNRRVVQGGAIGVDKYAFSLTYQVPEGDQSANEVEVRSVVVTVREIVGEDTKALSDNTLHSVLDSVYVRSLDGRRRVSGTRDPNSSRYVVDMSNWPTAKIEPESTITLIVGVDVAKNAPEKQLVLLFDGQNCIEVRDADTDSLVSVVDGTGDPIDSFWSSPLVVMSNNFQEYAHNYPNPFRAGTEETNITYFLNSPGEVSIKIYDLLGNLVYSVEKANVPEGTHEEQWDGKNVQHQVVRNGVYVCVLSAGGQTAKFRIAVAK